MKRIVAVLAVLLLPAWAWGQLPTEVKVQPGRLAAVEFDIAGKGFAYEVLGDLDAFREFTNDANKVRLRLIGYTQGEYWLILATVDKGATAPVIAKCKIVVGVPTPPVPPGPVPPGPTPTPVKGMRVLIVYETAEATKLPPGQQAILYGKAFRSILDQKTVMGPDGKTHEWRIYDKDISTEGESTFWQESMKRPRKSVPWIAIYGDAGLVHEGPLPASVGDATALINQFSAIPMRKAG